jgi:hypothetical protein
MQLTKTADMMTQLRSVVSSVQPQHPHNINTTLPLEERHYSIRNLLTVKKAEKSLKKRERTEVEQHGI